MAYWMEDEFPEVDINKVIKMCLIHDLGECFTGDIQCFKRQRPMKKQRGKSAVSVGSDTSRAT